MGYNVVTRCVSCGESAYIFRGHEVEGIRIWFKRHCFRSCVIEWAVDNSYSTPAWADGDCDFCLPDDLRSVAV